MTLVETYRENGYAIAEGAIESENCDVLLAEAERVFDEALRNIDGGDRAFSGIDDKYFYLRDHHPVIKSHCYEVMRTLSNGMRIATSPKILEFAKELGYECFTIDYAQIKIADKLNDRIYPYHQEVRMLSENNFTAWIPLVDISSFDGMEGLNIIPGSHKLGYLKQKPFEGYHVIDDDRADLSKGVVVSPDRGDVLFFDPRLIHESGRNDSDAIRWTLIMRYSSVRDAPYLHDEAAPKNLTMETYF